MFSKKKKIAPRNLLLSKCRITRFTHTSHFPKKAPSRTTVYTHPFGALPRVSPPAPQFNYHTRHSSATYIFRYARNDLGPALSHDRNLFLAWREISHFSLEFRESREGKRETRARDEHQIYYVESFCSFALALSVERDQIRSD